jgi:uncharacterized protein (DUF1697 family)
MICKQVGAEVTTYIGLLRAINVGGRNRIAMADLRVLLESLGYAGVQTLLQSGNVVFATRARSRAVLERGLEDETEKACGARVDYCVRTAAEWRAIVASNPYPKEAKRDPAHLVVMCLKARPSREQLAALRAAVRGPETVELVGHELYGVYPAGIGTSKLTNTLIESKLQTRGTARNWNTVLKLAALAGV